MHGKKGSQQIVDQNMHKLLSKQETRHIQSIANSFLYCARALESTMLEVLNDIGTTKVKPTENNRKEYQHVLEHAATYPNMVIRHCASDMMLHVDSDTAYLVSPNTKSRTAGFSSYHQPYQTQMNQWLTLQSLSCVKHFATLCRQQLKRKHPESLLTHN